MHCVDQDSLLFLLPLFVKCIIHFDFEILMSFYIINSKWKGNWTDETRSEQCIEM